MTLDPSLLLGIVFVLLLTAILVVLFLDSLRSVTVREFWYDLGADALTVWRTFSLPTWRWNWRTVLRSVCERGIEIADEFDERAAQSKPVTVVRLVREWESPQPRIEAQYIGEHVYVAVPGRVVRFKR